MIRWLDPDADMDAIQTIESAQDRPYPIRRLKYHLGKVACLGIVIEIRGQVVAYILYKNLRHALRILHFAKVPSYQGENQLIRKVISKLRPYHRPKLIWNVPECNLPLQLKLRDHFKFTADKVIHQQNDQAAFRFVYTLARKYCKLNKEINHV